MEALHPQLGQAQHRPGHVHQRVRGADLVEVDLLDAGAVHGGLRLGEATERRHRPVADRLRQVGATEDRLHVAEAAVGLPGLVGRDLHAHRRQRPAAHATHRDPHALQPQAAGQRGQSLLGPSGRDQRSEHHVPADPRAAVEPADAHDRIPLSGAGPPR